MRTKDRIIIALDYSGLDDAQAIITQLADRVGYYKVGLELLMAVGPAQLIKLIHEAGAKVFIDGKFNDIPHTIGQATGVVAELGADLIDVHASAGEAGVRAAVENKGTAKIIAVTILTSMPSATAKTLYGAGAGQKALQFARLAALSGAEGVVCSPKEARILRKDDLTRHLLVITPGIRPAWAPADDQKRFATPGKAIQAGADLLIIGRPITNPPPAIGGSFRALELIRTEIDDALTTQDAVKDQ
jgi:orotidine-5'-phosphate decarboxylase